MEHNKKPPKLKQHELRHIFENAIALEDGWRVRETLHTQTKHQYLAITDAYLAFKDEWKRLVCRWDKKRQTWRYTLLTTGQNYKWQKTVIAIDEKRKEVVVVTRYQEYPKGSESA